MRKFNEIVQRSKPYRREKDVEDALKLKKDEFEFKLNSEKKKEKLDMYIILADIRKFMEYGLSAGTDTNKLLEDKRKASGLKADLTTEAIQALEEGLKTKAIPKDEDDRQMTKEEIKKAKEAEKRVAQKLKVKNAMRNKWEFINDEIAEEVKADEAKLNERFKKKQGS